MSYLMFYIMDLSSILEIVEMLLLHGNNWWLNHKYINILTFSGWPSWLG